MSTESKSKSLLAVLVIVIMFIIGCLFIYWAVQYWVYNNFDRARYEMSKIQPAGGGDSWAFWKLDRRTGQVEYCSIDPTKPGELHPDFTCLRARTVVNERDEAYNMTASRNPQPPAVAEPESTAATSALAPVAPPVAPPVETPAAATPAQ